eukprot:XP_001698042.1 predicted protein [Chlamydomonas reinhardtii]
MFLRFIASGSNPPPAPDSAAVEFTDSKLYLAANGSSLRAVLCEKTNARVQATLLARNTSAWVQQTNGQIQKMQRGVMLALAPGDEVLFGPASATEPDAEPEVAFLLQSVDVDVGAALLRASFASAVDGYQASAGAGDAGVEGAASPAAPAPALTEAGASGSLQSGQRQSAPGATAPPCTPAAGRLRNLQHVASLTYPLSSAASPPAKPASPTAAATTSLAAHGTNGACPADEEAVAAGDQPIAEGPAGPATEGVMDVVMAEVRGGGAEAAVAAAVAAAGADVSAAGVGESRGTAGPGTEEQVVTAGEGAHDGEEPADAAGVAAPASAAGTGGAEGPTVAPHQPQQPQRHHARVKDEPLDEAPLGEPQPQQDEAQQEAAQQEAQQEAQAGPATEPPGTRPAKTPAGGGVDAVLNECKDIVSSVSEVLFPAHTTDPALAGPRIAAEWRGELQALLQRATMPRTTIGVVGDTGAGKSSLLNALLGEEDILPTNAMRASTGCPIEVSYSATGAYHAEVEFQTKEEWAKHLEKLLSDLLDENGVIQVVRGEGAVSGRSEAGVAQSMLEAVYGQELIRAPGLTADKLCAHSNRVTQLLGKVEPIRSADALEFRRKVGVYVDSHNEATSLQAWPIVKVCRIAHRWKLLEGGVVLVDLPGTRDANEARGRVAEEYMRRLSAVWIVADITRAVDNKTAKDLLGTDFKRRMVMDGQVHAITFICTKTDNLDVSSILESLSVEEVCARSGTKPAAFYELDKRITRLQLEARDADNAAKAAQTRVSVRAGVCTKVERAAKRLQAKVLELCQRGGLPVPEELAQLMLQVDALVDSGGGCDSDGSYCPSSDGEEDEWVPTGGKRKRMEASAAGQKKKGKPGVPQREPKVVASAVAASLVSLRAEAAKMPAFTAKYEEAVRELEPLQSVLARAKQLLSEQQLRMRTVCALARNHFSRERLQADFREGIAEMLQQAGSEDEEQAIGPIDITTYKLPVFCVSSREARKLEAAGSNKYGEATRSDGGPDVSKAMERATGASMRALPVRLDACVNSLVQRARRVFLAEGLQPLLGASADDAVARAPDTARDFDVKPSDPSSRMFFMTYRGVVHRDGSYTSPTVGPINWNGALVRPIMDRIAVTWARLFQSELTKSMRERLLAELDDFVRGARHELEAQVAPLPGGDELLPAEAGRLDELYRQVRRDQERQLAQALEALHSGLVETSKALSQDVVEPHVRTSLQGAYQAAASERGPGSYKRMRDHMTSAVERLARIMLPAAANMLLAEVEKLVDQFGDAASAAASALLSAVQARSELLWDEAPAGYEVRYKAAAQLVQLLERARNVCARAGVISLPPAFVLPPPPAPAPPAAAAVVPQAEAEEVAGASNAGCEDSGALREAQEAASHAGDEPTHVLCRNNAALLVGAIAGVVRKLMEPRGMLELYSLDPVACTAAAARTATGASDLIAAMAAGPRM